MVTFHDDLRLALSDERSRRLQHRDTRRGRQRHGSGDSSRCGGTVHVPVNSEVNRHPPGAGGGRSKAEEAAFRLRFLWRQPQVSQTGQSMPVMLFSDYFTC